MRAFTYAALKGHKTQPAHANTLALIAPRAMRIAIGTVNSVAGTEAWLGNGGAQEARPLR